MNKLRSTTVVAGLTFALSFAPHSAEAAPVADAKTGMVQSTSRWSQQQAGRLALRIRPGAANADERWAVFTYPECDLVRDVDGTSEPVIYPEPDNRELLRSTSLGSTLEELIGGTAISEAIVWDDTEGDARAADGYVGEPNTAYVMFEVSDDVNLGVREIRGSGVLGQIEC